MVEMERRLGGSKCPGGQATLVSMVLLDFWILLDVYVCLFESIVLRFH